MPPDFRDIKIYHEIRNRGRPSQSFPARLRVDRERRNRGNCEAGPDFCPARSAEKPVPKVDWRAQAREIWRGRVFSAEEVQEMEDYEQEGEEG